MGYLESPDAALVAQVIDVLAEANARDMTMYLLAPLLSPESDPAVRAAAAAALGRLAGPLPSRAEAAAVLSDRAEEYFQQRRVLHQDADGQVAEQVAGRQKRIRFQMYVPVDELPALLAQLRQDFSGSGIQYWVLPVIENGII